jgi:hypothetical protein
MAGGFPGGPPPGSGHPRRVAERSSSKLPDLLRVQPTSAPWWRRALYVVGAVLAFAAGIAGWVIPVLTGIPFWVAGFVLLAMASQRTRHVINALERRLPEKWRLGLRRGLKKVPNRRLRKAVNAQ